MNRCILEWNSTEMGAYFQEHVENNDGSKYITADYNMFNRYENRDYMFFFDMVDYMQKQSRKRRFMKNHSFNWSKKIVHPPICLFEHPIDNNTVHLISYTIDLSSLFDLIYTEINKYTANNPDQPDTIIIGKDLETTLVNGHFPDHVQTFLYKGLPKIIYIPSMSGIAVLGRNDMKQFETR